MKINSVAGRGGGGATALPHWHKGYANYPVFSIFEADFCTKNKNSPPPLELAMGIGHGPDVNLTRKTGLQSG